MKLIIDIPEELKQKIDEGFTNQVIINKLWDATKDGIPLEQIRAEIDGIEINGQVDEHTMFIRAGEQVKQMALDIIDKYKEQTE